MFINKNIENLYKEFIIDYINKKEYNYILKNANYKLKGHNPLCGDFFTIHSNIDSTKKIIKEISYTGSGCAISTASMIILIQSIKLKNFNNFFSLYELLKTTLLTKKKNTTVFKNFSLLCTMKHYPSRIKCVLLPWFILNTLLKKYFSYS